MHEAVIYKRYFGNYESNKSFTMKNNWIDDKIDELESAVVDCTEHGLYTMAHYFRRKQLMYKRKKRFMSSNGEIADVGGSL